MTTHLTIKKLDSGWSLWGRPSDWRLAVRVGSCGPHTMIEVLARAYFWRMECWRIPVSDPAICRIIDHMLKNPTDETTVRQGLDQLMERVDNLPEAIEDAEKIIG